MDLPSSRVTPLNTCPEHRLRWFPENRHDLLFGSAFRIIAFRVIHTVSFHRYSVSIYPCFLAGPQSNIFSKLNNTACILATLSFTHSDYSRMHVSSLLTTWLRFGQMGFSPIE